MRRLWESSSKFRYLVTVKGNQPTLHGAIGTCSSERVRRRSRIVRWCPRVEDGHGRHEERYVTVLKNPKGLPEAWADVGVVVMVGA